MPEATNDQGSKTPDPLFLLETSPEFAAKVRELVVGIANYNIKEVAAQIDQQKNHEMVAKLKHDVISTELRNLGYLGRLLPDTTDPKIMRDYARRLKGELSFLFAPVHKDSQDLKPNAVDLIDYGLKERPTRNPSTGASWPELL